jgi:hypothetical protein
MVAIFDRGFLYFADTMNGAGQSKLIMYGAIRVIIILGVSSITSQAVMPLVLGSEMEAHALHMIEAAEKTRAADLNTRNNIDAQETALRAAEEQIKVRQHAVDNLPADIQSKLASASRCWSNHHVRRAALLNSGYSDDDVRQLLAPAASRCSGKSTTATRERDTYLAEARTQLKKADGDRQTKAEVLQDAQSAIAVAVNRGRVIETESYTPRSSTVLWSLVTTDRGALAKWAILSFLLLVCELVPLIQKFQAGQSLIGVRRANNRAVREREERQRMNQSEHDIDISVAVNTASRKAIQDAVADPAVRETFAQVFAANVAAYAPTESVRAMMRDLEGRHVDVRSFMHRYPQYATIISQAWSKAVRQTAQLLSLDTSLTPKTEGA